MLPPRGGGALYSHLNDKTSINTDNLSNENFSAQEQVLNGSLELDPENDPVVYTTDYGLDIKFHQDMGTFIEYESGNLNGYLYFSAGYYGTSTTPINWVIIGKDENLTKSTYLYAQVFDSWKAYGWLRESYIVDTSPAGDIIMNDASKQLICDYINSVFGNAVVDTKDEIPSSCILCISAGNICSSSSSAKWSTSTVRGVMQGFLDSTSSHYIKNFTTISSRIQPQSLTSLWSGGTDSTTDEMFALAYRGEKFAIQTYLNDTTKCSIGANWWTRSGYTSKSDRVYGVYDTGAISWFYDYASAGVRPAFVLKI